MSAADSGRRAAQRGGPLNLCTDRRCLCIAQAASGCTAFAAASQICRSALGGSAADRCILQQFALRGLLNAYTRQILLRTCEKLREVGFQDYPLLLVLLPWLLLLLVLLLLLSFLVRQVHLWGMDIRQMNMKKAGEAKSDHLGFMRFVRIADSPETQSISVIVIIVKVKNNSSNSSNNNSNNNSNNSNGNKNDSSNNTSNNTSSNKHQRLARSLLPGGARRTSTCH